MLELILSMETYCCEVPKGKICPKASKKLPPISRLTLVSNSKLDTRYSGLCRALVSVDMIHSVPIELWRNHHEKEVELVGHTCTGGDTVPGGFCTAGSARPAQSDRPPNPIHTRSGHFSRCSDPEVLFGHRGQDAKAVCSQN